VAVVVSLFSGVDRESLVQAIDAVCGEGGWMQTTHFEPALAWQHALDVPDCPHHLLLGARDGGRVGGWCRLFPCDYPEPSEDFELGIGLLPAFRGQGVGQEMVSGALDWALVHRIGQVVLTTHQDNWTARRLFETFGFTPTGQGADGWLDMARRREVPGG